MGWRILIGALAVAGCVPVAATASLAAAMSPKASETTKCVGALAKNTQVTKSTISACETSTVKVVHPCPKGSSTIFVVVHKRTYALRAGHKPERLAKQFGMGTISQACGYSTNARATPTTGSTTVQAPLGMTTTT